MVKVAVIIAAGNGVRLKKISGPLPKPLVRVAGVPLLERVMRTALMAGIKSFVVVTGYQSELVRACIESVPDLADRVTWVHNPDFEKPNGLSVLAAKAFLADDFALLMSDHLFDPEALSQLLRAPRRPGECLLGVDRNLSRIFDLEDATKVRLKKDRIVEIGKGLEAFDAADTGIFVCTSRLFDALSQSATEDGCSLSDGVQCLAAEGLVSAVDIGEAFWQDVDTPESLRYAEQMLYRSTRKPKDGIVSRWVNRYISIQFSKMFIYLGVTPNQVTVLTFILGFLAALSAAYGDHAHVAVAGLLFQLSSVLDGSDGEVAKLKMTRSRKGAWLDTLLDSLTYLVFYVGVTVGLYNRTGSDLVMRVGYLTLAMAVVSFFMMYFYLLTTRSGSLRQFSEAYSRFAMSRKRNPFFRTLDGLSFALRRDFFSLLFCVFALLNLLDWIFAAMILGISTLAIGAAASIGGLLRESGVSSMDKKAAMEEVRVD